MMLKSAWPVTRSGNPLAFVRNIAQLTSLRSIPAARTEPKPVNHSLELSNQRKKLLARPGLLGTKRGMISWFTDDGKHYAATVIEIESCEVLANKTVDSDGYTSVLLGQIDKMKNISNGRLKLFENAGVSPKRNIGEFRVRDESGLMEPGTELTADYFAVGQMVDVMGVTKGKGFAGVMKRHGFKGLRATHGVSKAHRSAGSTGPSQDPGRVLPLKKMAGRMGGKNSTAQNLEVLYANGEAGILVVKGQIPGPNKAFIKIRDSKSLYGKSLIQVGLENQ
ncbi:54S ribosomal protein L9, mitochondrial [Scheffersomyces spartinae]|uniref:Large ribosomal subunit protein uL3m n=1 Tax=Scheffersomyces spartinae TaxID=45513 RepID=A0A9P8AIJ1_9ASCO|nr:54S ribosomal protein L9, mitochondrial [Scheffersomyces spartinae]KAG7194428.1 54S ribosomal protein L9, mitochondrial [Scheffersomyces spartinae]